MLEQSFDLPIVDDGLGGPYPMGDEVSTGRISQEIPLHMEPLATSDYSRPPSNPNRVTGRRGSRHSQGQLRPQHQNQPHFDVSPISNNHSHSTYKQSYDPQNQQLTTEFNSYSTQHEQREYIGNSAAEAADDLPPVQLNRSYSGGAYRTQLGNQSMI